MTKKPNVRRSRREAAEDRRRHIVETAAICFAEKGFHQTSIRDIAQAAGISLGNLYNHFDGKDALVAEIASIEAEEMKAVEAALRGPGTPRDALQAFARAYLDLAAQPVVAVLTAEITAEALRNPPIAGKFETNRERTVKSLKNVLADGAAAGQFGLTENATETARLILDLLDGAAFRMAFLSKRSAAHSRSAAIALVTKAVSATPR